MTPKDLFSSQWAPIGATITRDSERRKAEAAALKEQAELKAKAESDAKLAAWLKTPSGRGMMEKKLARLELQRRANELGATPCAE